MIQKVKEWLKNYFKSINLIFYISMIALAIGLFLFDYFTKIWAYRHFESQIVFTETGAYYPGKSETFIPGLLEFTLVFNNGAAWNWLSEQKWILVSISFIASAALLFFLLFRFNKNSKVVNVAITLMFAGAFGNLIDRFGYMLGSGIYRFGVIDFLKFSFIPSFPVCNIADYCLTVGVVLLLLGFLIQTIQTSRKEKEIAQSIDSDSSDQEEFKKMLADKEKEMKEDSSENKQDGTEEL